MLAINLCINVADVMEDLMQDTQAISELEAILNILSPSEAVVTHYRKGADVYDCVVTVISISGVNTCPFALLTRTGLTLTTFPIILTVLCFHNCAVFRAL